MARLRIVLVSVGFSPVTMPRVAPPLGILSLAAYVRERFDVDIRAIHQRAERCSNDSIVDRVAAFAPDVVGFSALTAGAHLLPELTRRTREALPEALIVLGGPFAASVSPDRAIESTEADLAVPGEGEIAFERILRERIDGGDFSDIPGLIRRAPDGKAMVNPGVTPFVEDLDSLPIPAYDLIDIERYWKLHPFTEVPPQPYVSILTTRGCPYNCSYCHRVFGKRFRAQSPARLLDEIEYYGKTYGVSEIEIVDDIFNLDAKRVFAFAEEARRRDLKLGIRFPNGLRTDLITAETADALRDAGTYIASCALESGSPRIQESMGKRLNIPRFVEGVSRLVERGVFVHGFTMLGFPTETAAEMRQTIDTICGTKAHTASFFTVTPYPGTALYDTVMQTAPGKLESIDYADSECSCIRANVSAEPDEVLFALQREAWRRFYLTPRRMWRILRAYPKPLSLPAYLPMFVARATKGLFAKG